ncbi:MAG: VOC family protein [Burkholderiales bacterium]
MVRAATLDAGAEYVRAALGVELEPGGTHERMGTHNRLLKLGNALNLELIAIDPSAAPPSRARWFGLDRIAPDDIARLVTWAVRTRDIDASVARAGVALGSVETMTRGMLNWRLTVPADGSLPLDGVMPSLIQWDVEQHPADRLRDSGCSVVRLEARHILADRIEQALHAIGFAGPVIVMRPPPREPPSLTAVISTPTGQRTLGGFSR